MKKLWVSVKRGLIREPKHRIAMGECSWLFMYMLDVADWETGVISDWKDEAVADDMQMPIRTIRDQRRKLEELNYITCEKKQYSQAITVMNWTNPREYTGEVYNQKQSYAKPSPSEKAQSDTQSDTQSSTQNVTPTSYSKTKDQIKDRAGAPKMQKPQKSEKPKKPTASDVPELVLYRQVTKKWPPETNWNDVIKAISEISTRLGRLPVREDLLPFYSTWTGNGWNQWSINWLNYAIKGELPILNKQKSSNTVMPKGAEAALTWLQKQEAN